MSSSWKITSGTCAAVYSKNSNQKIRSLPKAAEQPKITPGAEESISEDCLLSADVIRKIPESTVRRTSSYTSFRKNNREHKFVVPDIRRTKKVDSRFMGSLTVEAAMTVPLFLFTVYLLWIFFSIMSIHVILQAAADDVSGQLAQQSFLLEEWQAGTSDSSARNSLSGLSDGISLSSMLSDAAWKSYAKNQIISKAGKNVIAQSPIASGAGGISVMQSQWRLSGDLDLRLDYKAEFPALLGFSWKIGITQHSLRRCWTGSQSKESGDSASAEEMVYITPSGTVYHRDAGCYHLLLTVREVSYAAVSGQRNNSGGGYTPCERCAVGVKIGSTVYVAKEGNRYHTTRDCAGLRRSVTAVPISQAGGRRACSDCGS